MNFLRSAAFVLFSLLAVAVSAQIPGIDLPTGIGGNTGAGSAIPDTITNDADFDVSDAKIHWFLEENAFYFYPMDTGIRDLQLYQPGIQLRPDGRRTDLQTLGVLGSASLNLDFAQRFPDRWDYNVNYNPYQAYMTGWDGLRFYRTNKPYTELTYSLGAAVEQSIGFRHTQNVVPNANFAIDYKRWVSEGELGNQKTGIHDANISAWYRGRERRYAALLGYTGGVVNNQENGGISVSDSVLFAAFPRENAGVNLLNASHGLDRHNIRLRQYWQFSNDKPDTVKLTDSTYYTRLVSGIRAWHELSWERQSWEYFDVNTDTSFYPAVLFDEDTTQVDYGLSRYETSIGFGNITALDRGGAISHAAVRFNLGLHYRFDRIQQTIGRLNRQQLFLKGWFGTNSEAGQELLIAEGGGRINSRGEYDVRARAGLSSWPHEVTVGIHATRYNPTVTQDTFFTNHYIWFNDFNSELQFSPELSYRNRNLKVDIKFRYHRVSNYLYWDTEGLPAQAADGTSVLQVLWNQDFRLGKFHFENRMALQYAADDEVSLPLYWGKHSVFYQSHFFEKATFVRLGVDVRISTEFFAQQWNPVAGNFFLQEQEEYRFYPVVDLYVAAQVKTARIFLRGNNLAQGLTYGGYFPTPGYVTPSRGMTLGVNWVFWY